MSGGKDGGESGDVAEGPPNGQEEIIKKTNVQMLSKGGGARQQHHTTYSIHDTAPLARPSKKEPPTKCLPGNTSPCPDPSAEKLLISRINSSQNSPNLGPRSSQSSAILRGHFHRSPSRHPGMGDVPPLALGKFPRSRMPSSLPAPVGGNCQPLAA